MNNISKERLHTWVYLTLCFGSIFFLGIWVAFQPDPEGPDLQEYFEMKKKADTVSYFSKGQGEDDKGDWEIAQAFLEDASLAVKKLNTKFYQDSGIVWELESDYMTNSEKKGFFRLENVRLVDSRGGKGELKVTSKGALLNWRDQNLELFGNVDAFHPSGYRMLTEKMTYNEKNGLIESKEKFECKMPDNQVFTGVGFSSDPDFENVVFHEFSSEEGIKPFEN